MLKDRAQPKCITSYSIHEGDGSKSDELYMAKTAKLMIFKRTLKHSYIALTTAFC